MKTETKTPVNLTTLIVLFPLLTLFLYAGLSYLFLFYNQKEELKKDLKQYEKTLMRSEQMNLEERLNNLTQFIRYYDNQRGQKIKDNVKNIVNVTVGVANNLYHQYKDSKDDASIKELIANALSKIKFEGNIGYLFLLDLKGNVHLHVDENLVGTNILNIRDVNGKYILKEFNKVLQKNGEGFVDYYWYVVGENKKNRYHKISYVKKLDAFDWYVGAGQYLKYMSQFVRKDILEYVKANATFDDGYFFITDSMNQLVFQPYIENKNVAKADDLRRFRIEGLYEDDHHIAYTKYIAQYDWYVTAVRDLNSIKANIAKKKKLSELKRIEDVKTNLYLMVFTWLISLGLSLYLSLYLNDLLKKDQHDLHEANEKLVFQSRQALIGELFPMIAHQWRQPINKIASTLALLRFDLLEDKLCRKEIDERYQSIEENIEFMSETIDDFNTFYRPKKSTEMENLDALIIQSINFMEGSIKKKDIKIHTQLDHVQFKLHSNEFLQVMINLIKNAIDSSLPNQRDIKIKLYKDDASHVVIEVEDNGRGVDQENLPKLFNPYYTTKQDSMGIGLYMTKMIIEKHMNGSIEAQQLTQGLRFVIKLKSN